jgi:ketosteroid isomerase-like protein
MKTITFFAALFCVAFFAPTLQAQKKNLKSTSNLDRQIDGGGYDYHLFAEEMAYYDDDQDEVSPQSVNDEQELQAFTRRFMAAYNAQDHAELRKMYTDDAVRMDPQGKQIKGAANIAAYFAEQFVKNNSTLLLKHTGIGWSDAEHAWVAKGNYEVYGKTYVYDIPINIVGSYANAMEKKDGVWKIAKSVLTTPDMSNIKAEIKEVEDAWAAASNAKDVATIVGFYADDAISMQDDKPMLVGKAAIQKGVEAEMARQKKNEKVVFETLDLYGDENRVTEVGKATVTDATGKVTYAGKYMAVWEKRNGKWLTVRDISNDDAK